MTITDLQNLINTNLASASGIIASEHREVESALLNEFARLYEVKELDIPNTQLPGFLTTNFDATGKGIGNYDGFAICNGQNGTRNRGGRTSVGYDPSLYNIIGAIGGSKDAVLVAHSHTYKQYQLDQEVATTGSGVRSLNKNNIQTGTFITSTEGESGTGKNMQPYIVTLFIQRIA